MKKKAAKFQQMEKETTATNVTELHNHTFKDKINFSCLVVIIPETTLSYLIQVARDKCL